MEENSVEIKISISGDVAGYQTILDLFDSAFRAEFLEIIADSMKKSILDKCPQTVKLESKQEKRHLGFVVQTESTP